MTPATSAREQYDHQVKDGEERIQNNPRDCQTGLPLPLHQAHHAQDSHETRRQDQHRKRGNSFCHGGHAHEGRFRKGPGEQENDRETEQQ